MVVVKFVYDEPTGTWEPFVLAESELEAKQAFNAVVLSCQDVMITIDHEATKTEGGLYKITPFVSTDRRRV